jgi:glycosyltransferase involved in cell wall biosynthesis
VDSPFVSVVTPVYNGEQHLAECIESILRQTYDQWEYVVVDNSSSDRTPDIVESFARRDSRVRLSRYEAFVDAVASYNRAFASANPESAYTKVVGADDWLYPECLERMVGLAEEHREVGVVGAYRMDDTAVDLVGLRSEKSVAAGHEILRQSLGGGPYVTGSPTSLLYRSELTRGRVPFYDPSFRHADTEAVYWVLTRSDFGLVHEVLTFTRRPPAGETPVSVRLSTYTPENLRMLLRYGPDVFGEAEFRRRLRIDLAEYVWWHAKQRLRPSRHGDDEFRAFHLRAVELISAEAGEYGEVKRAMRLVRRLLRNGRTSEQSADGFPRPDGAGKP